MKDLSEINRWGHTITADQLTSTPDVLAKTVNGFPNRIIDELLPGVYAIP
jgi:hypothetical protein